MDGFHNTKDQGIQHHRKSNGIEDDDERQRLTVESSRYGSMEAATKPTAPSSHLTSKRWERKYVDELATMSPALSSPGPIFTLGTNHETGFKKPEGLVDYSYQIGTAKGLEQQAQKQIDKSALLCPQIPETPWMSISKQDVLQPDEFTTVTRIRPEKRTKIPQNSHLSSRADLQRTPPRSLPTKAGHYPPRNPSPEAHGLLAAEYDQTSRHIRLRNLLSTRDRGHSKTAHSLSLSSEPDSKSLAPMLSEGPPLTEIFHRQLGDLTNLCPSEEKVGRGRRERTPCPKEMKEMPGRNAIRGFPGPLNSLSHDTQPSRNIGSTKSNGNAGKPFDLGTHHTKRQRIDDAGNRAGYSATSPFDVDDRSNTARSEDSRPVQSLNKRRPSNHSKLDYVSDVTEFKEVENLLRGDSRKRSIAISSQSSQPSKKQCSGDGVAASIKGSDLLEDKSRSSTAVTPSIDLVHEDIEEVSRLPKRKTAEYQGGSYKGTARPPNNSIEQTVVGKSSYFRPSQPQSRRIPTTQKTTGTQPQSRSHEDDSMDELAMDYEMGTTKEKAARAAGAKLLQAYSTRVEDTGNDIPKSKFMPSMSGNTTPTKIKFYLSGFVAGVSKWKDGQGGVWHLVLDCNTGKFKPYRDDLPMSKECSELVVDPTTIRLVKHENDLGGKIMIKRSIGAQKSPGICFQLGDAEDPGFFMTILSNLSPGFEIKTETADTMRRIFRNLYDQKPGIRAEPERPDQDLDLLTRRQEVRQGRSSLLSQGNNKTSFASYESMWRLAHPEVLYTNPTHPSSGSHHSKSSKRRLLQTDGEKESHTITNPSPAVGVVDRLRRSTRAATQDQRLTRGKSPSPPPSKWTDQNPQWRKNYWGSLKSQLSYPQMGKNQAVVDHQDIERLNEEEFLNDNLISFYMRYLQENLQRENPEIANKVHFHNTFFYETLTKGPLKTGINYNAVSRWTSKVDLFSKEFIVVPITESLHWYLAIIYNAPALKHPKPELLSEEKEAPTPSVDDMKEPGSVQAEERAPPQQTSDQSQATIILGDSPLPLADIEKMSIEDEEKLHLDSSVDQRRHRTRSGHQAQPVAEEALVVNDLESRGTPAKDEIPHSQPNSPKAHSGSPFPVASKFTELAILGAEEHVEENASASASKKSSKPPKKSPVVRIVLLDSLSIKHPATISNLKEYLVSEADAKLGMTVDKTTIGGLNVTKIPKQDNGCDCGLFLLGYAEKFLKDPSSFVQSILNPELEQMHWGHMVASEMRTRIRDLIFRCKADQHGRPRTSPEKSVVSDNGNPKSLHTISREGSEQLGRTRPSFASAVQELHDDHSRPTSSGSQGPKMPEKRAVSENEFATKERKVEGADTTSRQFPIRLTVEKSKSPEELGSNGGSVMSPFNKRNATREKAKLSSPITPASPGRNSSRSLVQLEPALLSPLPPKATSASTSKKGSPNNPITLNEDQTPSSSRVTLRNQDPEVADHKGRANKLVNTVVKVPGTALSDEVGDSQERMLLDYIEGEWDEENEFLNHPVTPDAISDKSKIPSAAPDMDELTGTSGSVSTPAQTFNGISSEFTPRPKTRATTRPKTYTTKKQKHTNIVHHPVEIVDLDDE